ncbi:MAG: hypothetical protein R8M46_06065 [Ghiorsea sp.]
MNNTIKAAVVAAMMALFPMQAAAADYEVANVMDDAIYGAGVGGMVGAGLMLLSDKPTDNWNYLTRGIGIGIIAGAAFGVFRTSKSLAQVEDGEIKLGMPTPELAFQETALGLDLVVKTDLIRGSF